MAFSRYRMNRPENIISEDADSTFFDQMDKRGTSKIEAYPTPKIRRPGGKYKLTAHIWEQGDKFWKLSSRYYGDPGYWHIIAHFNYKPTEAHVTLGETIYVPTPLDAVLSDIRY